MTSSRPCLPLLGIVVLLIAAPRIRGDETASLHQMLTDLESPGGLAVHLGTTDGSIERELTRAGRFLVHGLSLDPARAHEAREQLRAAGVLGRAQVETVRSLRRLPYATRLVNLLVADLGRLGAEAPKTAEILRVLAPGGVAWLRKDDRWEKTVQARPEGMDVWTHYNHYADGNPVSTDRLVEEPHGLRWITSQVMGWGMFSVRATEKRVFLFWDTRTRWYDPVREKIRIDALDAYSGVLLWSEYYDYPEVRKSRPVAVGDRIYLLSGPHVVAVDARDGRVLRSYRECETPYDAVLSGDVLLCRNDDEVFAFDAKSAKLLWKYSTQEHADVMARYGKRRPGHFQPGFRLQMLVAGNDKVFFADHRADESGTWIHRVIGFDVRTGEEVWQASGEPVGEKPHPCFYSDGVLYLVNENGYNAVPVEGQGKGWSMPVYSWKRQTPGHFGAFFGADIRGFLASEGLAWIKDVQRANLGGLFPNREEKPFKGWIGIDPRTGEIRRQIRYPSTAYWSGRCYPDVAIPGRIFAENMEIVDLEREEFRNFRAARGQCGAGFIVANGLIYTNPIRCVSCYPMLRGACALSGESDRGRPIPDDERLWTGPAHGTTVAGPVEATADEWPMYRKNALRTNTTPMEMPPDLSLLWSQDLGERATAPVVAEGRLLTAVVSRGEVRAFDAATGRPLWRFLAPARVDSPPTIHGTLCLFGCHDGSVWCLPLDDGQLVWRRDCAPEEKRIVAYDRVESPWPVLGSVLVHDDVLYALAGRLTRVDGGMHLWALDPETGREIWRQHLPGIYGEKAGVLPHSWYIDEEHMVNNLLVAKDQRLRIYDQYGGWQFSTKDGRFEGQSSDVLQPGWPKGRRTPKNDIVDERWPWCGWDRVTSSEVLAGQDTFNVYAVGMSPDRRGVGGPGQQWLFPRAGGWGIHSREILKEKHFVLRPVRFGEPDLPDDKLPWKPRKLSLDIEAYVFTDGGDKLLIAGGLPFSAHPERGRLLVISMKDGRDLASLELDAVPIFDGLAAAGGRIYVSTVDGRVLCVGADRD